MSAIKAFLYRTFIENFWSILGWAALGMYSGVMRIDGWSLFFLLVIVTWVNNATDYETRKRVYQEIDKEAQ